MKKLMTLITAVVFTMIAFAATEKVDGYTWSYRLNGNSAEIYTDDFSKSAVSPKPTGALTIPSSLGGKTVTSIGNYALRDCSGITNVIIPDGVTEIKSAAFSGCTGLTTVVIPDSVISFGFNAFASCSGLIAFVVGESNTAYCSVDGLILSKDGSYLVEVPENRTNVTIPDSVTCIGVKAFGFGTKLVSVEVPNGVSSIENGAFAQCEGLLKVIFKGDAPTTVGQSIFPDRCVVCVSRQAKGFEVDKSGKWHYATVEYYGPEFVIDKNGKLTSVTLHDATIVEIPNGVTSIGNKAFYNCSGMSSVLMPNSVTNIESDAFNGCKSLKDITIPSGVISIGSEAFLGCSGLTSVTIPSGVISIGYAAFKDCSSLANVSIPSSVISIGSDAFNGCRVTAFVVDEKNRAYTTVNGLLLTKDCTSIVAGINSSNVIIPDTVTEIKSYVFKDCKGVANLIIPNSVTSIGSFAFAGCSGLSAITVPNSVTYIGDSAFSGCSGLTEITLPFVGDQRGGSLHFSDVFGYVFGRISYAGSVAAKQAYSYSATATYYVPSSLKRIVITDETVLPKGAFDNCPLTDLTIPKSVTSINSKVFVGCYWLENIHIYDLKAWCDMSCVYDDSMGDARYSLILNGEVVRNLTIPDGVEEIRPCAFSGCLSLESVTIPDGVKSIGSSAFMFCENLKEVSIPEGVTSIGRNAFLSSGLECVTIPDSIDHIGSGAFSCFPLSNVTIPQYVCSSKLSSVFSDSYWRIANVVISDRVTSLSSELFAGCVGIKKITAPMALTDCAVASLEDGIAGIEFAWSDAHTGGDENWDLCQSEVHSGSVSWQSGTISHNQQTWLEMNVETPGRLSFWWKASSESDGADIYDYAYLSIDGLRQGSRIVNADTYRLDGIAIGGKTEWTKVEIDVSGSGQHAIRWTYCKDDVDEAYVGDDCVWLDDIVWTPLVCVSFDIRGAEGVAPTDVVQLSGTSVLLPDNSGFKRDGYVFSGWSDGVKTYGAGESFEFPCDNVKLNAVWIRKSVLTFTLAKGCGTVPESISGVPGTKVFLPLAIGFSRDCHTFEGWNDGLRTYDAGAQYEIADKDVVFAAVWSAKTQTVPIISSVDVENGGVIESEHATIAMTADDGSTIHYTLDGSEPSAQSLVYTAPFVADGMSVVIKAIAVKDDCFDSDVATFSFTRKPYSLAECIGIVDADVATGGNTGWQRILGAEAHDGVAALKSNAIGDGQTNWVQVTVFGAGSVSFWWKVSCEGTNRGNRRDGCVFMVDGQESKYTDGTTNDWTEVRVEVLGGGEHKFKWAYGKNDNGTFAGDDCAWLDSVVWTPKNAVATIDDLAKIFGGDSLVVEYVNDEIQLAAFNNFLDDCSINSASDLKPAQKQFAYQSFKLSEITTAPQLFEEEPVLKIDNIELSGGNLSVTISLTAGAEAIQLAKDKLAEKIRVGTSIDAIITPPNILVGPSVDGMLLTYTIIPPQGNQGFVKVQIE